MEKKYTITFRGEQYKYDEDTLFKDIAADFQKYYTYPILGLNVDNDIVELSSKLNKNCKVNFYDRSSFEGYDIYSKSALFILVLAVKNVLGKDIEVSIEHSMDYGVFCKVIGKKINAVTVNRLYQEMQKIVKQDYLYVKSSVARLDAIKFFKKKKVLDKVDVLKYISNTYINLYRINDEYDYFYGKMAYNTGQIDKFKLTYIKDNGFVMLLPSVDNPNKIMPYKHHEKVFDKFREYLNWSKSLNITNIADLNKVVSNAKEGELISLSEAYYDGQLSKIADEILHGKKDVKIVLIAGPSSSGKTTTSKKLDIYLKSKGFKTHPIALDDYFIPLAIRPKDENGNPDFESIRAVDTKQFNKDLSNLLKGKKVELPHYNFELGEREYNGDYLQLGKKDIIIVEGLHALNKTLTESIPSNKKYKVFISPFTGIGIDSHSYVHTSDIRRLRRIVRDSKTRGLGAKETLAMWPTIRDGERENIFRFQDNVDTVINSSLLYEIGVLKTYVEPLLFNVTEEDPEYMEALRLINFLRNFLPIASDDVPQDSVLREFIGGSCFKD